MIFRNDNDHDTIADAVIVKLVMDRVPEIRFSGFGIGVENLGFGFWNCHGKPETQFSGFGIVMEKWV